MSKGIDYSKRDNLITLQIPVTKIVWTANNSDQRKKGEVGDIDDMIGKKVSAQQAVASNAKPSSSEPDKANAQVQEILDKGGKVNQLTITDYYLAAELLDLVTPDGMRKRNEARAKKGDCYLYQDPAHIYP
eukprot:scaffold710_cov171-Amphora_coffeaeformis.AAC.65